MLVNLSQHVFKTLIYPNLWGYGFGVMNTAYNMCALLIIMSPIAYCLKLNFLKDFVFWFGSAAGIIAIAIPYWHIGQSPFTAEYIRYMLCHILLFVNSVLPLILGHHKTRYRMFPVMGIEFIAAIAFILLNDTVCYYLGFFGETAGNSLREVLAEANPVWSFGPPEGFEVITKVARAFVPDSWAGANEAGKYLPIIWYAIPLYLLITALAFVAFAASDFKSFSKDISRLRKKPQKVERI